MLHMPHGAYEWAAHPLGWLVLYALVPTAVLAAIFYGRLARRRKRNQRSLYGDQTFRKDLSFGPIRCHNLF